MSNPDDEQILISLGAFKAGGVTVARDTGEIKNVSVITTGPALGHGFDIDETTLSQVCDAINQRRGGVKMRLGHPGFVADGTGTCVGTLSNARVDGDAVRADAKLGRFAEMMPNGGNAHEYLLRMAEETPQHMGLSIVFKPGNFKQRHGPDGNPLPPVMRIRDVSAADFVDEPAANPKGLLSVSPPFLPSLSTHSSPNTPPASASLAGEPEPLGATPMPDTPPSTTTTTTPAPAPSAVALEEARVGDIRRLSKIYGLGEDFVNAQIAANADAKTAMTAALAAVEKRMKPATVEVGEDRTLSTISDAIPDAICMRAGVTVDKPSDMSKRFAGLTVVDMVRHYLSAHGLRDAFMLSRVQVVNLLNRRELADRYPSVALSMATGDFPALLVDAINKSLRQAYTEAPSTWQIWARRTTAPDFKTIHRIALSEAPDLTQRDEGGPIQFASIGDSQETYALVEYTSGLRITRKALINDDLDGFGRLPGLEAAAAKRKEDQVAYAIITGNPALIADGIPIFDARHNNVATTPAALSVASLAATEKLLLTQTMPNGAFMELTGKYLLVPTAIYRVAQQLMESTVDPAKYNITPNPFKGEGIVVVPSARLNAASPTAWYLLADTNRIDTVEVAFLADEPEPVLMQETEFGTEDVKFAVRHTVAAKALDFRGMVTNAGA